MFTQFKLQGVTKLEKFAIAIIYSIYTQLRTLSTSVAALRTTDVYIWLYLSPSGSRLGRPWPLAAAIATCSDTLGRLCRTRAFGILVPSFSLAREDTLGILSLTQ